MESIYILLFTYMSVKSTELKNLCNTHKPWGEFRHKRNTATMLTAVMDFRITRKALHILIKATRIKNIQNNK